MRDLDDILSPDKNFVHLGELKKHLRMLNKRITELEDKFRGVENDKRRLTERLEELIGLMRKRKGDE